MKKRLFIISVIWAGCAAVGWSIPSQITYQGTVKQNNVPINGTVPMSFRITTQDGSVVYWSSGDQQVSVTQGLFAVTLNPVGFDWQNITPYMEVSVNGQTLQPREPINASVYSLTSGSIIDGAITTSKIADGAVTTNKLDASLQIQLIPPGTVIAFAGQTAPPGWLLCNGFSVDRKQYAALFAGIGTTWGLGDGVTTFNLPDLQGRTIIGSGSGASLTPRIIGTNLGEETHTLSVAEMPAHNHDVNDPGHTHGVNDPGHSHSTEYAFSPNTFNYGNDEGSHNRIQGGNPNLFNGLSAQLVSVAKTGISVDSATTGITTKIAGSGAAHNIMQPSTVMTWIIKY